MGDPCDDGDSNTINDVVGPDCQCMGFPDIACPSTPAEILCMPWLENLIVNETLCGAICIDLGAFFDVRLGTLNGNEVIIISETCGDHITKFYDCQGNFLSQCVYNTLNGSLDCSLAESTAVDNAQILWTCDDVDPDCETMNAVDCPDLGLNIGDGCNDQNPNTINDTVLANCECQGTTGSIDNPCYNEITKFHYGGSQSDTAVDFIIENDGYVILGNTNSSDIDISQNNGSTDIWIFKVDFEGNIIWEHTYGSPEFDGISGLLKTNDNGYLVSGWSGNEGGDIPAGNGLFDGLVLKLNSQGNLMWIRKYGGSSDDRFYSAVNALDGGYMLAGRSSSSDFGFDLTNSTEGIVAKIDNEGNLQWVEGLGDQLTSCFEDITLGSDNQYVATGIEDFSDYYTVKFDQNGQIIWRTRSNFSDNIESASFQVKSALNGDLIVGGYSAAIDDQSANYGFSDYLIVRLNSSGQEIWKRSYGGSTNDEFSNIEVLDNGHLLVSGFTLSDDFNVSTNYGSGDYWFLEIDDNGHILWERSIGSEDFELLASLKIDDANRFVLLGNSTNASSAFFNANYGQEDIWLHRFELGNIGEPCTLNGVAGTFDENCVCIVQETNPFITSWKTDNPGASCNSCVTIPTNSDFNYNYEVDWDNDGIFDETFTGDAFHDFGVAGSYDIAIRGTFPNLFHDDINGDNNKLVDVKQWGDQAFQSMRASFRYCDNIIEFTALDTPDLSMVVDMSFAFANASNFNSDISGWNVSNVQNMEALFSGTMAFNQNINTWDVRNVTSMQNMFATTTSFNQSLNNWNTSSLINARGIFYLATAFNGNINNWDVRNVVDMTDLFAFASNFNQPLNNWETNSLQQCNGTFLLASAFNQDVSNWNVSNVEIMSSMFSNASSFNQDISSWDVSNVQFFGSMFEDASAFDRSLSDWNLNAAIDLGGPAEGLRAMLTRSGLSRENYEATLLGWSQNPNTPDNLTLGAETLQYCDTAGRNALLSQGWTINGDVQVGSGDACLMDDGEPGMLDENCMCVAVMEDCPNNTLCNRACDSLALVDLYNATDGINWTNPWDLDAPIQSWFGVRVSTEGCVDSLILPNNNLVGSLPDLNLPGLLLMDLNDNQLSSALPSFTKLHSLRLLNLNQNGFTGAIPDLNLDDLQVLQLVANQFVGPIPDFSGMPQLRQLVLVENQFNTPIPNFSQLANLQVLAAFNAQLIGEIPTFEFCPMLSTVDINSNDLSGCYPDWVCNIVFVGHSNPKLPDQGDPINFCQSGESSALPCDDGDATNGIDDIIYPDCNCGPCIHSESMIEDIYCEGESVMINGTLYDMNNSFGSDTLVNGIGCDSVILINLIFEPPVEGMLDTMICNANSLTILGITLDQNNPNDIAVLPGAAANGCDSLVNVSASFAFPGDACNDGNPDTSNDMLDENCLCNGCLSTAATIEQTECLDFELSVGDDVYDMTNPSGTTIIPNTAGCDSLVNVMLSFYEPSSGQIDSMVCNINSVTILGITLDPNNPDQTAILANMDQYGCDSLVQIQVSFQFEGDPCDDGDPLTTNDIYDANCICTGCLPSETDINMDFCFGESLTVGGDIYDETNPIGSTLLINAAGCDSLVNVNLSYFTPGQSLLDTIVCNLSSVVIEGNTFDLTSSSQTITLAAADQNGCDSIMQINVTFQFTDDPCDDGNPETINDSLDEDCECRGEDLNCEITCRDDFASYKQGDSFVEDVLGNDDIPAGCRWIISKVSEPVFDGVAMDQDGKVVGIIRDQFSDTLYIDYEVCNDACNLCESATLRIANEALDGFIFPTAFSPDGDGLNDSFSFNNEPSIENGTVYIYNRWGDRVYKSANYDNAWKAEGLPGGVYFYVFEYNDIVVKKSLTIFK